ncbi:hypothetical protein HanRHA438_Chr05g0211911 [Helianthus annuus]|nr:hypothetical protein HanRHA438_Chr05g0211911 [Helianthus annuus]
MGCMCFVWLYNNFSKQYIWPPSFLSLFKKHSSLGSIQKTSSNAVVTLQRYREFPTTKERNLCICYHVSGNSDGVGCICDGVT